MDAITPPAPGAQMTWTAALLESAGRAAQARQQGGEPGAQQEEQARCAVDMALRMRWESAACEWARVPAARAQKDHGWAQRALCMAAGRGLSRAAAALADLPGSRMPGPDGADALMCAVLCAKVETWAALRGKFDLKRRNALGQGYGHLSALSGNLRMFCEVLEHLPEAVDEKDAAGRGLGEILDALPAGARGELKAALESARQKRELAGCCGQAQSSSDGRGAL